MLRGSMQSSPWVGALLLFGTAGALSVSCVDDDYSVPADPRAEGGASDGGASDGGASGAAADGVSGEGGGLGGAGGAAGAVGGPFEGGAGGDSGREASGGTSGGAAGAPGSAGAAAEGPGLTQGGAAGSGPDPEPPPDAGGAGGAPEDDGPCADDPCNGRGECSAPNGEVLCTCDGPYFGARCETPRFEPLGLPRSMDNRIEATGVSADGSVVVGWSQGTSSAPEAFRWEAGAFTRLGTLPGGIQSKAFAVSGDGRVVVGEADAPSGGSGTANVGFSWEGGAMTNLGVLEFGTVSRALAVNEDGSVIVGSGDDDTAPAGIIWEDGAIQKLGSDLEPETPAGISADGTVVAGQSAQSAFFRVLGPVSVGFMQLLDGATSCRARGLSADGSVAVGSCNGGGGDRAARWAVVADAPATDLGTLDGSGESRALASDESGARIVGESNGEAVVWLDDDSPESLAAVLTAAGADLAGFQLAAATGISADGRVIVGYGQRGVRIEAFIARLP